MDSYTSQYRPISSSETTTDAGLSVRFVSTMANNINNAKHYACVHKLIGEFFVPAIYQIDEGPSGDIVVRYFAKRILPAGTNYLDIYCVGRANTGIAATATFKLYASSKPYRGQSMYVDTSYLAKDYTTASWDFTSLNHQLATATLNFPRVARDGGIYFMLTYLYGGAGGWIDSIDVIPRITTTK